MKNSPFFSNFIEEQTQELSTEELQSCAGGGCVAPPGGPGNGPISPEELAELLYGPVVHVTMKHPSDDDEGSDFVLFDGNEASYVR